MITKEIYQIGGSGFSAPEDAAASLIYMDGRAAIVDAGCGILVRGCAESCLGGHPTQPGRGEDPAGKY